MSISKTSKMLTFINYRMRITIKDDRQLVGTLMAFDKHMNLVLGDTEEFRSVLIKTTGNRRQEKRSVGLVVIRGECVISITAESAPEGAGASKGRTARPSGHKGYGVGKPAGRGVPTGYGHESSRSTQSSRLSNTTQGTNPSQGGARASLSPASWMMQQSLAGGSTMMGASTMGHSMGAASSMGSTLNVARTTLTSTRSHGVPRTNTPADSMSAANVQYHKQLRQFGQAGQRQNSPSQQTGQHPRGPSRPTGQQGGPSQQQSGMLSPSQLQQMAGMMSPGQLQMLQQQGRLGADAARMGSSQMSPESLLRAQSQMHQHGLGAAMPNPYQQQMYPQQGGYQQQRPYGY